MSYRLSPWVLAVCLMATGFSLFSLRLGYPRAMVFDEHHYVPAAKELIQILPNRNYEHPPLAKLLMGISISALGDHPVGWRAASCVAGTLAIGAVFWLALVLYNDLVAAALAGWLALTSGLILTMSRLAMLDVFAAAFAVLALAALMGRRPIFSALAIGAALACKWSAIPVWVMMLVAYPIYYLRISPRRPLRLGWWLSVIFIPVLVYGLSYVPLALVEAPGHSPQDLLQMQAAMWQAQVQPVDLHLAHLPWWRWPIKLEPWWLFSGIAGDKSQPSLMMLASPVVILGGCLAMLGLACRVVVRRDTKDAFLLAAFAAVYFVWALSPRSNHFYYYFLPGSLILSIALARGVKLFGRTFFTSKWNDLLVALVVVASGAWMAINFKLLTDGL